jgi:hypothetical protein
MPLKSFINTFILLIASFAVTSCVPKATEKKAVCGTNQAFNTVTRSCYSVIETRSKPVATKTSEAVSEERPQLVTLTYTDANKDKALSCKVSSLSSNLEMISPLITDGTLFSKANDVVVSMYNVANAVPMSDTAAAVLIADKIQESVFSAQQTVYAPNINAKLTSIKADFTALLAIAAPHLASQALQDKVNVAQQLMDEFIPVIDQVANRCDCLGGVCTTQLIPKANKFGSAAFSYTVTDVDGESATKTVNVSISPMARTAAHLLPTGESSYHVFLESATSASVPYGIDIPDAADAVGTADSAFKYTRVSGPSKGTLTGCMGGTNNKNCTYTPTDGDSNDGGVTVNKGTASIGGLVFNAKNEGSPSSNYTVQIFDVHANNLSADAYVTPIEAFGMALNGYKESFVRVQGNAIKVFVNPGVTTNADVVLLLNDNLQTKKMIVASTATPLGLPTAGSAVTLSTVTDAFDSFTYTVSNGSATSVTNKVIIKMEPVNDAPVAPRDYIGMVAQQYVNIYEEKLNEPISFPFKDVDSQLTSFTIDTKVEDIACSTDISNAYFNSIGVSNNLSIAPSTVGTVTCTGSNCAKIIDLTANLDFNGRACLYYRVTDSNSAVSAIQKIDIEVDGINDEPLLSSAILPIPVDPLVAPITTATLGSATILEDLDSGLSYATIYASAGGNGFESNQELSFTVTSMDPVLIPSTSCTSYTLYNGSPVNVVKPTVLGELYFDYVNFRCYKATGTTANTQWKLHPSITVYPYRSFTRSGTGSPVGVITTNASGEFYLDTAANKSYISYLVSGSTYSWKYDSDLTEYKVAFVPNKDQSSAIAKIIKIKVTDNGGVLNSGDDSVEKDLALTVTEVNDPPYLDSNAPIAIHTNEGGAVQTDAFYVDEDEGRTVDEDKQEIAITNIVSDNTAVLPVGAIKIFYDVNDNGVEDAGEARAIGAALDVDPVDAHLHAFYMKLDPVDGLSGNANVTLTISDNGSPAKSIDYQFSFIVHSVAALHGGWDNISAVGMKSDKNGAPVTEAELRCNYNLSTDSKHCSTGDCTGTSSPHSVVIPEAANVIYWDSSDKRCYRSVGTSVYSWVEFSNSCPITRDTAICAYGGNCIASLESSAPLQTSSGVVPLNSIIPSKIGLYYYNANSNTCYVSTGKSAASQWEVYVPAKVTLAWKPFTMVGSGGSSGATIAGWNVYRREVGGSYNFKNGFLTDANSTVVASIANPTIRTFVDTTAIAGKVYYYVVRPVDSLRLFATYTPEVFSEVRVLAPPANYSFVHRWMVNQEICNGMKITTATTPSFIDQAQNFRCQYKGPGESPAGYYDYGKDLLVDTNETGCAYGPAPKCSVSTGCVGINAPSSSLNVVDGDLYYNRTSGMCYRYDSGWVPVEGTATMADTKATNSALNPPLVNITQAQASAVCSTRPVTTVAGVTLGATTLPSKRDYNGYASHPIGMEAGDITVLETGGSLDIYSRCNGSLASGLTTAFTDSVIPSTSFSYAITGTDSSGIRSIYTGSIPWGINKGSQACVSRFGVQDVYGNVAEWTTDKMTCAAGNFVCTSAGTGSSFSAYDFDPDGTTTAYYAFDYLTGPYNDYNGDNLANITGVGLPAVFDRFLDNWTLSNGNYSATKFSYPVGLPISGNLENAFSNPSSTALPWALDIGPTSGIVQEDLHEDGMIINGLTVNAATTTKSGAFAVGGSYLSGQRSGRFTAELIQQDISRKDVGMRCIVPINAYPGDLNYTYPY